jgi:hypothetical protein
LYLGEINEIRALQFCSKELGRAGLNFPEAFRQKFPLPGLTFGKESALPPEAHRWFLSWRLWALHSQTGDGKTAAACLCHPGPPPSFPQTALNLSWVVKWCCFRMCREVFGRWALYRAMSWSFVKKAA